MLLFLRLIQSRTPQAIPSSDSGPPMPPYPGTVYSYVVVMVTLLVVVLEGMKVMDPIPQVDPGASVVQLSLTGEAKPATGETETLVVMEWPAITCPEAGVMEMMKSMPFPVRFRVGPA